MKEFVGWIDERDLRKVKMGKKLKASMPTRHLIIYDKHWYDGHCRKVLITVSNEKK